MKDVVKEKDEEDLEITIFTIWKTITGSLETPWYV